MPVSFFLLAHPRFCRRYIISSTLRPFLCMFSLPGNHIHRSVIHPHRSDHCAPWSIGLSSTILVLSGTVLFRPPLTPRDSVITLLSEVFVVKRPNSSIINFLPSKRTTTFHPARIDVNASTCAKFALCLRPISWSFTLCQPFDSNATPSTSG